MAGVGARKESNEFAFPRGKAKGGDAGKATGQAEQVFVKPDMPKYHRWFLFGPFQNPPVHLPRLAGDGAHGCSPPGDNKACDEDIYHIEQFLHRQLRAEYGNCRVRSSTECYERECLQGLGDRGGIPEAFPC